MARSRRACSWCCSCPRCSCRTWPAERCSTAGPRQRALNRSETWCRSNNTWRRSRRRRTSSCSLPSVWPAWTSSGSIGHSQPRCPASTSSRSTSRTSSNSTVWSTNCSTPTVISSSTTAARCAPPWARCSTTSPPPEFRSPRCTATPTSSGRCSPGCGWCSRTPSPCSGRLASATGYRANSSSSAPNPPRSVG